MSAIANITVFDGAASPASHTLTALRIAREGSSVRAYWRENLSALPLEACPRLTVSMTDLPSGVVKTELVLEIPNMESVSGQNAQGYTAAPKVAFVDKHIYTCLAAGRSTQASRRLARQMLVNLLGNISTSVTPVTTGTAPEAIDQVVMPT